MVHVEWGWADSDDELIELQHALALAADDVLATDPWSIPSRPILGGCFIAYARGEAGPGRPGDRAWAAAVAWRPDLPGGTPRPPDRHLAGTPVTGRPRQADDVLAQAVVADHLSARYVPGLLARREGPVLAAAVSALHLDLDGDIRPDVVLVDATGADHPRRAGLAIHLGAVIGVPTVGVTRRPLVATGDPPELHRGRSAPVTIDGDGVGSWVCTKTGARPVLAHAGWRTSPATAVDTVLAASTEAARTPVPLQEARRVAREARSLAGA